MPQPQLERFTSRGLLLAAAGTTLLPGTHGLRLLDGKASREFDKIERNIDSPFLGGKPFVKTRLRASIEGTIEITPPAVPGAGVTGVASVAPVLLIAGLAETQAVGVTRYSPISSGMASGDGAWYQSGTFMSVTNCRSNLSSITMEIGKTFGAQTKTQGSYTVVAESALPVIDYSAYTAPTPVAPGNSQLVITEIDGVTVNIHLWGKSLTVDMANDLKLKDFTEHEETAIDARPDNFKMQFARPDFAEFNPQAISDSHKIIKGYFKLTEADGRASVLNIRGQIETVTDSDIDGDFGYEISGPLIPSDAGGDEFSIEFTAP